MRAVQGWRLPRRLRKLAMPTAAEHNRYIAPLMENLTDQTFESATIFQPGFPMGYRQSEVKDLRFAKVEDKWGKVISAVKFVFRGKRKKQLVSTSGLVIIEGWNHPELEVWENDSSPDDGIGFQSAKYSALSDEWDTLLDDYLDENKPSVIYDGRVEDEGSYYDTPSSKAEASYPEVTFPDEIDKASSLREGAAKQVLVNKYERSSKAREQCLSHHGYVCKACQVDMEATYGEIGRKFVHVHHRVPLSEIGADYKVDPVEDLIPVCPNCHSMIHRPKEMMTVEELREVIESNRNNTI